VCRKKKDIHNIINCINFVLEKENIQKRQCFEKFLVLWTLNNMFLVHQTLKLVAEILNKNK